MKNDVRKLTDGAMMTAIMGVVLLIDRQTAGLLSGTVLFLFPLPMVFFGAKYGWKNSWMVYACMMILAVILSTPATAILVAAEGLIGMIYGCGIYDHVDTKKLVLRTIIAAVLTEVLTTMVFAEFFGYDIMAEAREMETMFTEMSSSMNAQLPANMDIEQTILVILMLSVILTGVLDGLVLHLFSRLLFKRLNIHVQASTPLAAYVPPKWSGYAAILATVGFYYAFSQPISNDVLKMALEGIGMCGNMYLAFYGMVAAVMFINMHTKMGVFLSFLLAFLLFIATSGIAIALLGFLYITTDMHHRMMLGGFKNDRES